MNSLLFCISKSYKFFIHCKTIWTIWLVPWLITMDGLRVLFCQSKLIFKNNYMNFTSTSAVKFLFYYVKFFFLNNLSQRNPSRIWFEANLLIPWVTAISPFFISLPSFLCFLFFFRFQEIQSQPLSWPNWLEFYLPNSVFYIL